MERMKPKTKEETTPRGEKHVGHKLTENDVKEIRSLVESGQYSKREIARCYGVSQRLIQAVAAKKAWKHVD